MQLNRSMKRIQLFEFEDLAWFPKLFRDPMTRLINVMHKLLKTSEDMTSLMDRILKESGENKIVDLCSGGGGPMVDVYDKLKNEHGYENLELQMTDLYPNKLFAESINTKEGVNYSLNPVDATKVDENIKGVRTMVGSFHHMDFDNARKILEDAKASRSPICILELSDNSTPKAIWWIAIFFNLIFSFIITLFSRPLTWKQLLFTYLIPIIPIAYAWDGAVSNARTYSKEDLTILLDGLEGDDYKWETGVLKTRGSKMYLLGKAI